MVSSTMQTIGQAQNKKPRYLAVIFAGGAAKRFGDVKAVSFIHGEPILYHLYAGLKQSGAHVAISVGQIGYLDLLRFVQKFSLYDGKSRVKSKTLREQIEHMTKVDEIRDYIYENLDASVIFDTKKGMCLKNLAEAVNGKFELMHRDALHLVYPLGSMFLLDMQICKNEYCHLSDLHKIKATKTGVELDPVSSINLRSNRIIEVGAKRPHVYNICTGDARFLWQLNFHDLAAGYVAVPSSGAQCGAGTLDEVLEMHREDMKRWQHDCLGTGDGSSCLLRFRAKDLEDYIVQFENKPIVALNADVVTLGDILGEESHPILGAIERGLAQINAGAAAHIGLFPLATHKTKGRSYKIGSDGRVKYITVKDYRVVTEEAVVFAFKPDALLKVNVPDNASTSDLCKLLIDSGYLVTGERINEKCYDLNKPEDSLKLRSDYRLLWQFYAAEGMYARY